MISCNLAINGQMLYNNILDRLHYSFRTIKIRTKIFLFFGTFYFPYTRFTAFATFHTINNYTGLSWLVILKYNLN